MNSFEYIGEWWLPGKCDEKAYGTLTFAPNEWAKLEITIEGDSDTPFLKESSPLKPFSIVLGMMNARPVTLCHCSLAGHPFTLSQGHITRKRIFLIQTVFVGAHFESLDDILLDELTLGYTHLDEWMGQFNFEVTTSAETGEFSVAYSPFDPVKVVVKDLEIEFVCLGEFSPWMGISRWYSLREEARISLRPRGNMRMTFWDYVPFINLYIPTLLTVATRTYNYPMNVSAVASNEAKSGVSIYYSIPGYIEKSRHLHHWAMLFRFDNLNQNGLLQERLSNWISKCEKLRAVTELYFRFYYQPDLDIETKFLFVAQMMEAYQRSRYGGKYPTLHPYKRVSNALIAEMPEWIEEPLRTNLEAMIRNGNKFSFKSRILFMLQDVLIDHKWTLRNIIGNFEDFATKVTSRRNRLTHRTGTQSDLDIPKEKLPEYVANMETIMRLCFLVEIGFTSEEIETLWGKYVAKPSLY